ncbi:MAG: protein kinase [candidate division WOR-3 bacterium]|nr:MAG: protein kinase [candidate division WOR-3 bacterium]
MIGKTISHYKILEQLGSGGMGVIYKALDTKLQRTVALKFLPQDLTRDPVAKQRFIKEAQTASSLDHPNICTIHEIDETEEGQLFIAMACYKGETLNKKIARGPVRIEEALSITIQVAQGLTKAHKRRIVHRDIKPGNIFITEEGQVKLLDFGLAKLAGETRITQEGATAGTIAYMSPEQARGKEVDTSTDIWSLGVVLYEMLTGKLPFKGENWRVTLYSILNTQPESIKQLRADIPDALESTLDRMIQKNTKARYQDTTTLITDLCGIARESRLALPQTLIQRQKVTHKLTKLIVPALVLALAASVILITRSMLFPVPSTEKRKAIAVMAFKNLSGENDLAYLSVAIPNLLITSLQETGQLDVITWERMHDLAKAAGKEVELIDEEVGFELCRHQGIETIVLGSFTKAGDVFATDAKVLDVKTKRLLKSTSSKGESIASIINNQIDELTHNISIGIGMPEGAVVDAQPRISDVTTSSMEAYTHFLKGREYFDRFYTTDARRHFEAAIELDSTFATAYLYLAWTLGSLKEQTAMEEAFKKAKEFTNKATERERLYIEASHAYAIEDNWEKYIRILNLMAEKYPDEKRVYSDLGYFYRRHRLFDEAIKAYSKSLKLDADFGEALTGIAYTYLDMEVFNKALEYFQMYQSIYPDDANTFDTMADIFFHMGNPEKAIDSYKKALEVSPDFVTSAWKLAYIYALKENYDDALQWCDYYVAHAPSHGKQRSGYAMKVFFNYWLGNLAQWQYNFQKLTQLYETAEFEMALYSAEGLRGTLYYELGDFERSRRCLQNSLDYINIMEPSQTPWHIAYVNYCFGFVDLGQGKLKSARSRLNVIKSLIPKIARRAHWIEFRHDLLYAEILLRQDSLKKAIEICQNMPAIGPPDLIQTNVIVNNQFMNSDVLARAYQCEGKLEKAIAEYEHLVTFDPKSGEWHLINPQYHYRLAQLYEEKGRYSQAIAEYEKYIDILNETDIYLDEINKTKERLKVLTKETR